MNVSDDPKNWMFTKGAMSKSKLAPALPCRHIPLNFSWQWNLQGPTYRVSCRLAILPGVSSMRHGMVLRIYTPHMSIHRKSALRPRNDPSSNDLLYLIRKNMWNTKSRPARAQCPAHVTLLMALYTKQRQGHHASGHHNSSRVRKAHLPKLPKKRKFVKSRQTSHFWYMSRALKYILKGVMICNQDSFVPSLASHSIHGT